MPDLSHLNVGDQIARRARQQWGPPETRPDWVIQPIERVTATQLVLAGGHYRVNRQTGRRVGHGYTTYEPVTPEMVQQVANAALMTTRYDATINPLADLRKALEGQVLLTVAQREALAAAWATIKEQA